MSEQEAALGIYLRVDAMLRGGQFAAVDRLLRGLDCAALSVLRLLAYLSITSAARPHLLSRDDFAARVRERIERDDPKRAATLLRGLA